MKKLVAKLFIALVLLGGIPSLSMANTNSPTESFNAMTSYYRYRLPANSVQTHQVFLNRGYARIMVSGDGDTDLDLYIYDSTGLIGRAESYGDDEIIPITIYNGGYFTVKVVNRGNVYNDYALIVQ